ncbi:hypothetical protein L7F22_049594 [Adiantum nelumboides]|nr:hypothetical protein [Adiantum nelumboides]
MPQEDFRGDDALVCAIYKATIGTDFKNFLFKIVEGELRRAAQSKKVIRLLCAGGATQIFADEIVSSRDLIEVETQVKVHCNWKGELVGNSSFDLILGVGLAELYHEGSQLPQLLCPGGHLISVEAGSPKTTSWKCLEFVHRVNIDAALRQRLEAWGFVNIHEYSGDLTLMTAAKASLERLIPTSTRGSEHQRTGSRSDKLVVTGSVGVNDVVDGVLVIVYSIGKEMELQSLLQSQHLHTCYVLTSSDEDFSAATALCRCLRNEKADIYFYTFRMPTAMPVDTQAQLALCMSKHGCESEVIIEEDGMALVPRVVKRSQILEPSLDLPASKTFFLLGGVSSLGIELAHWLYSRGARRFVLTSRSGRRAIQGTKSDAMTASRSLDLLRSYEGVSVRLEAVDATDEISSEELLRSVDSIGGIFLMPLVLVSKIGLSLAQAVRELANNSHKKDQHLFDNQTKMTFKKLFDVKYRASKVLVDIIRRLSGSVDFVIYLSTFGVVLGGPGQTNYYAWVA